MDVGKLLGGARRQHALGLRQLAHAAGTSHATLHAYETGRKVPRADTLERVLRAAGWSLDVGLHPLPPGSDAVRADLISALRRSGVLERVQALHGAFAGAGLEHAFGGDLALAWCTGHVVGGRGIEVHVFVARWEIDAVLAALPRGPGWSAEDVVEVLRAGRTTLDWEGADLELVLSSRMTDPVAAARVRHEVVGGVAVPVLSSLDLAKDRVLGGRRQDWQELSAMAAAGCLDIEACLGALVHAHGGEHPGVERLRAMERRGPDLR